MKTITTIVLFALSAISATAQTSLYKNGEEIRINDKITIECLDMGSYYKLKIKTEKDIEELYYHGIRNTPDISYKMGHELKMSNDLSSDSNVNNEKKMLDIFCNLLTLKQCDALLEGAKETTGIGMFIQYDISNGKPANISVLLNKDYPSVTTIPPVVYAKFMAQVMQDIRLVDIKYKAVPYIQGQYAFWPELIKKRYLELHK